VDLKSGFKGITVAYKGTDYKSAPTRAGLKSPIWGI
jgi:hypothetical protein